MKFTKITSFIIAGCIALGGTSISSNDFDITSSNDIVTISSTLVQDAPRMVPNFPMNQPQNQTTQSGQRVVGNMPQEHTMIDRNFNQQQTSITRIEVEGYNDPGIYMQYAISQTNASLAWSEVEQVDTVSIAVIDTGVDYTHDDLKNRVSTKYGYDFVNNDNDPMDDNGHGTHVSGIIAAQGNNGIGIVGMVGDLDVEIIPIKALDKDGLGDVETVVKAIEYAINLDVDIINLSFGTESKSKELDDIVSKAIDSGIFVVVAAGNSSTLSDFSSPVSVDGVCAVGATSISGDIASFSNFGLSIDVGAPGEEIVSTYPNNEYSSQSGTSMACPIVASAAAILLAQDPTLTVEQINYLLDVNAVDVSGGRITGDFSFGIVDMYASLQSLS